MKKVLAFDFGASNGRAILAKYDGKKITLEEIHRFENNGIEAAGGLYWDILYLLKQVKIGINQCVLKGHSDIASLAFDTWGVDYALFDSDGDLLGNPYHYRDKRNEGMDIRWDSKIGLKNLYFATGVTNIWFNTSYQLMASVIKKPQVLSAAQHLLLMPDAMGYLLTGVMRNEYTTAATTQLFDQASKQWNLPLMEKAGLPARLFGKIIYPGEVLGSLKPALSKELGIGEVPVTAVASHDTASAVAAVPYEDESFLFISSGTWSLVGTVLSKPIINEKTYSFGLSNEGTAGGGVKLLKNIMGLWLVQQCRRFWISRGQKYTYDELSDSAESCVPFRFFIDPEAEDFINPTSMPAAIKDYCQRTGQTVPESSGEIIRCIMDSLAMKYRSVLEQIEDATGKHINAVHIIGGGSQDRLISQLTANASGRTVFAGPVEATAIGNAVIQLAACGAIRDMDEGREIIRRSFPVRSFYSQDTHAWNEAFLKFRKLTESDFPNS